MHLATALLPTLLTLATTTSASPHPITPSKSPLSTNPKSLSKRCSPRRDPDLALGYYPPAPCWQTFDPACQPYLAAGTEMLLDQKHGLAVVYGVSESCVAEIEEEARREREGRKNYGWRRVHGVLTVLEKGDSGKGGEGPWGGEEPAPGGGGKGKGRTLVISGMSEEAVERYARLTYREVPGTKGE